MYISHMRSEGNRLLEAVDELITIAREARIRAEIYHLKAAGKANWPKLDEAIAKIEAAQRRGSRSPPTCTPTPRARPVSTPRCRRGCRRAATRRGRSGCRIRRSASACSKEMTTPTDEWENLMLAAGGEGMLLVGFKNEALQPNTGKTLAEVAKLRGTSARTPRWTSSSRTAAACRSSTS